MFFLLMGYLPVSKVYFFLIKIMKMVDEKKTFVF
jgi:hypothetical protein